MRPITLLLLVAACEYPRPADVKGPGEDVDAQVDATPVDGTHVACSQRVVFFDGLEPTREVWVADLDGSGLRNISSSPTADDYRPSWSPDGEKIVFESNRTGNWDIFVVDADSNLVNLTVGSLADERHAVWSPDGQRIAFVRANTVWVMNTTGGGAAQLSMLEHDPTRSDLGWSPDGTKVMFSHPNPTDPSLFVATIGATTDPVNVTPGRGRILTESSWAPSPKILFSAKGIGPSFDVFSVDADATGEEDLTRSPYEEDEAPRWSSNGDVVFTSTTHNGPLGVPEVWKIGVAGNLTQLTINTDSPMGGNFVTDVSPDGQLIAFDRETMPTKSDIAVMNIDGTGTRTYSTGGGNAHGAVFAPCGD